jgi:hypothetical protein
MAINGIVHGSHEVQWGIAEESTFGTAIADNGSFYRFDGPVPDPDYGVFHDNEPKNFNSRVLEDTTADFHSEAGGTRVIPFSDVNIQQVQMADLLYGVMQSVSEGAATPWEKTFTWVGEAGTQTTQPDFSANAGHFMTLGIYDPIASNHRKFTSCILRNLTLACDLTGGDGRLKASGEFISGFPNDTTANFSGTWTSSAAEYYDFTKPTTKTVGAADIVLYGFSITLNNNAVRVGNTSAGSAETYAVGIPMYETTGSLTLKYDAVTDGLIANMIAGTSVAIQLATGTDGADGNLDFLLDECVLTGTPKDYGRPEGQAITIDFTVKADYSSGAHTTITMSDDTGDRAW